MASEANIQNMEMIDYVCRREVEELQRNLNCYLADSARMRCFISSYIPDRDENNNMFGYMLMAYDSYMSNMEAITDLARKFNVHLQLKKLGNVAKDCCQSAEHPFKDYLPWNINREQHKKEYDLGLMADDKFEMRENIKLPIDSAELLAAQATTKWEKGTAPVLHKYKLSRCVNFFKARQPQIPKLVYRDLREFTENYEFSATISYVEDYENLIFHICQLDNALLSELSNMCNLPQLQRPPIGQIFGVSKVNKILRAIVHIDGYTDVGAEKLCLIDFGEVVPLDDMCVIYQVPTKYQKVPIQAIKCVLVGFNEIQYNDRHQLANILRQSEHNYCSFRVVHRIGRVLHVLLLQENQNEHESCKTPLESPRRKSLNPFLRSCSEDKVVSHDCGEDSLKLSSSFSTSHFTKNTPYGEHAQLTPPDLGNCQFVSQADAVFSEPDDLSASLGKNITHPDLPNNEVITLIATCVPDVDYFYAHIGGQYEAAHPLYWTDEDVQPLLRPPQVHAMVLAKYSKDGGWYRAEVVEIDEENSSFKVFYVDYGNTETININCMAKCLHAHLVAPFRAVRCRWANIRSTVRNDRTHQQTLDLISLVILDQSFKVKIVERSEKELLVRIIDEEYVGVMNDIFSQVM